MGNPERKEKANSTFFFLFLFIESSEAIWFLVYF
jgi:hypothetical protein